MTVADRSDKENTGVALPQGWHYSKLKDVIIEAQPGFACGTRSPVGVIQLRMNNVNTIGNFVWNEYLRVPTEATDLDKYRLEFGDILFNNTNSTELVGKSALFRGYSEPIVYSNHFTRIRVNTESFSPAYIVSWLIWQYQLGTFAKLCNRWIGQSAVKNEILFSLEIPLPPLTEQESIAGILNEQMAVVEKACTAVEERLEAAKALPSAYLREIFDSEEAKKWQSVRLGDICKFINGDAYKETDWSLSGVPIIRIQNLNNHNKPFNYWDGSLNHRVKVSSGDLLLGVCLSNSLKQA